MTQLHIYKKHLVLSLLLLLVLASFAFFSIKAVWFLASYPSHQGHEPGVFGSPIPLLHASFYALYWAAGFFGMLLLLLRRRAGWVLSQIITLSGTAILLLAVIISAFTPLQYFDIKYISILIVGCLLLLTLNSKYLLDFISVKRVYDSYKPIVVGVLILAVVSIFVFDVFSLN